MRVKIFSAAESGESISVECTAGDKVFEITGNARVAIQASVDRYTWVEISRHVVTTTDTIRRSDQYPWWRLSILSLFSGTVDAWCNDTIPQRQRGIDVHGSEWFPEIGDGETDIADVISDSFTRLAESGKTLKFDDGDYRFGTQLPDVTGFKVEMSPGAKLTATVKTGMRIRLAGENSAIIGGEIRNQKMCPYRVIAATQAGGANTSITVQLHAADVTAYGNADVYFAVGETLYTQGLVLTAGAHNGTSLTIASLGADTITFAARTATLDTAVSYPYDRLDGHGRTIYPITYRSRTQATNDALILLQSSTNALIREVSLRWSALNAIYAATSYDFTIDRVHARQTAADGIHFTQRCGRGRILYPVIEESQDDCLAFVGYKGHGGRLFDIDVFGPKMKNQFFNGRGLGIIGAKNVRVFGMDMEDIYGAGIIMGYDSTYETYGNIGCVVDGFSIKTSGNSGSVPTGWQNATLSSVSLTGQNVGCAIRNGNLYNCRYRSIGNSSSPQDVDLSNIRVVEANGQMQYCSKDSLIANLSFDHISGQAISLAEACTGVTTYRDIRISNVNRGSRRFIKTVSVASGTITIVLEPGQSHGLVPTDVVIIQSVGSAYTGSSNEATETAKDYAINGQWTLATVTADAGGDILTVTGSGLSDTTHTRTRTPEQPCPHAYLSLASGSASSTDGILADSDLFPDGRIMIEGVRFGELLWPMERTIDDGAGADSHRLTARNISCDTSDAVVGGEMLYLQPARAQTTTISADSNQAIDIAWIRRGQYVRTGLTTGRSDTFPTAAEIVAALAYAHGSYVFEWEALNLSAQTLTLLTNTGLTLTGTMTVAATTKVLFTIQVTNAAAGSEAVTITRRYAQSGLGA